jgi:hypothetical protein
MTNTTALIKSVNESHWAEDYNDAALPSDKFLRRRLARRAEEAGLNVANLVMGEFGPAGAYAYKIHNEQQ